MSEAASDIDRLLRAAVSHQNAKRHADAVAAYRGAITAGSTRAEVHNNLGIALRDLGEPGAAAEAFRAALGLRPAYTLAAQNLAALLRGRGDVPGAAQVLDAALAAGGDAALRIELSILWSGVGRPDLAYPHALASWQEAPEDAYRRSRLGTVLMALGRPTEAIPHHAAVAAALPQNPTGLVNLAHALLSAGRAPEAAVACADALARDPDSWPAWHNRLLALNYLPDVSPAEIAVAHRQFGQRMEARIARMPPPANDRDPDRPLRVGLVSGDFRSHSVGFLIEGVLAAASSGGCRYYAYANQGAVDRVGARIRSHLAGWRSVQGMTDDALAAAIRADRIDILVDLSGHTGGNRLPLFARRVAPVQVAWMGYPQTTGLAAMDWIVGDPVVLPPEDDGLYVERIYRLPGAYLCFAAAVPPIPRSPAPVLARGHATFGCFNGLAKLNDRVLAAWARILAALPEARMLLKTRALGEAGTAAALRARFAAQGGDPSRLTFDEHLSEQEHHARFADVDLMLDPFPYGGCTTTIDALRAGVPTLALRGRGGMMTRSAETLLAAAGLADWVARDEDDYVAQAIRHARDPQALAALRERVGLGSLADAPGFARKLEAAWRAMWRAWCGAPVSAAPGSPAPPR